MPINLVGWQRSVERHAGKLFKLERKAELESILDHCVSFDTAPVVAGQFCDALIWLHGCRCCRPRP